MNLSLIETNLAAVRKRIEKAAAEAGRNPSDIKLVAVSKTKSAEAVIAAAKAGATIFGENYIQETADKIKKVDIPGIEWHFIGHLQSNKAKQAVRIFDMIHSVDSFRLAKEIDKQAKKAGKIQNIMIQVNISMEETKSGISEAEAEALVRDVSSLSNISVKGLMTMPPFYNEPSLVRPYFNALRTLAERISCLDLLNVSMSELSMGMTGDFEQAIMEGSTYVRVGTAIFGSRS